MLFRSSTVLIAYSLQPFLFYWLIKRPTLKGKSPITIHSILRPEAYFGKKGLSYIQIIRNNYEYKGYEIEMDLRDELKATEKYKIFEPYISKCNNVLNYGCKYGFVAYWFVIKSNNIKVFGYDNNNENIALANNCYLKNNRILFSSELVTLKSEFDLLILDNLLEEDSSNIQSLIGKSEIIIIRNNAPNKIVEILKSEMYVNEVSDKIFSIYKKQRI